MRELFLCPTVVRVEEYASSIKKNLQQKENSHLELVNVQVFGIVKGLMN